MEQKLWYECAEALRDYLRFENKLEKMDVDLAQSAAGELANKMFYALCDGDDDWAYDPIGEINWLLEWAGADEDIVCFRRIVHTAYGLELQDIYIGDARDLYNFIVEMRAENWPEKISEKWRA